MRRILLFLLFPLTAFGACTGASPTWTTTPDQPSVNTCVNSAIDGDTINITAGSATWNTGVTATGKGISIVGAGTQNSSASTFVPGSGCTGVQITDTATVALFNMNPSATNSLTRISCMQIAPGTPAPTASPIQINGTCSSTACPNTRIDNITIPTAWTSCCSISDATFAITNNVFGVVDHNSFNWGNGGVLTNPGLQAYLGVGSWGDNSWAQPDTFGGSANLFIENNSFNGGGANDCDTPGVGGCRVVCRFNQATNLSVSELCYFHGTDTNQRTRGGRQMEVYGNNVTGTGGSLDSVGENRSGVSRFFGNTIVNCGVCGSGTIGVFINAYLKLDPQRRWRGNTPYGPCDGTGAFDTNDGTIYFGPATISSTITQSGSVVGINTSGLTANQWAPSGGKAYSVHDITAPGSGNEIVSNTTTVINFNTNNLPSVNMTAGDSYNIQRATVCLDQPGRSGGNLLSGGDNTHAPTPTSAVNQSLDPTYEWMDTGVPAGKSPIGSTTAILLQNRDFYMENRNQGDQTSTTSPFDGTTTIGMGHGTKANRPATCTTGVGYWANNEGSWNNSTNTLPDGTTQGNLYICGASGWPSTPSYTPFTYPHPLISGGGGPPPSPTGTLSPASLNFGSQVVGTTSTPLSFTFTNNGPGNLTISNITLAGDYAQTNNCPGTLNATTFCTFNVTFTPTALGIRSGSITITSNASNSPSVESLSGTGVTTTTIINGVQIINGAVITQ